MSEDLKVDDSLRYKIDRMAGILGYTAEEIFQAALTRGLSGIGGKDVKAVVRSAGSRAAISNVYIDEEILRWLEVTSSPLPIEHFQMSGKLNKDLRSAGARTVGDMVTLYRQNSMTAAQATILKQMEPYIKPIVVNWIEAYRELDLEMTYPVLTCQEFRDISPTYLSAMVNHEWLGCEDQYDAYLETLTLGMLVESLRTGLFLHEPMPEGLWPIVKERMLTVRYDLQKGKSQGVIFKGLTLQKTAFEQQLEKAVETVQDSTKQVRLNHLDDFSTIIPEQAEQLDRSFSTFLTPGQQEIMEKLGINSIADLRTKPIGLILTQDNISASGILKLVARITRAQRVASGAIQADQADALIIADMNRSELLDPYLEKSEFASAQPILSILPDAVDLDQVHQAGITKIGDLKGYSVDTLSEVEAISVKSAGVIRRRLVSLSDKTEDGAPFDFNYFPEDEGPYKGATFKECIADMRRQLPSILSDLGVELSDVHRIIIDEIISTAGVDKTKRTDVIRKHNLRITPSNFYGKERRFQRVISSALFEGKSLWRGFAFQEDFIKLFEEYSDAIEIYNPFQEKEKIVEELANLWEVEPEAVSETLPFLHQFVAVK